MMAARDKMTSTDVSAISGLEERPPEPIEVSGQKEMLPGPLDCIRCEALAVAGFTKEATAISAVRVAIDELGRAYEAYDMWDGNGQSGARLDRAILHLIGKNIADAVQDGNE